MSEQELKSKAAANQLISFLKTLAEKILYMK